MRLSSSRRQRLALVCCLSLPLLVHAQLAGSNDDTFNVTDVGNGQGYGPYAGAVDCMVVMPDDKVMLGGAFTYYNAVRRKTIARTLANGDLDTAYHIGPSMSGEVFALAAQPDGKVLAGGSVVASQFGHTHTRILRLDAMGTLDTTFDAGTGFNGIVRCIALQADGKILVGGEFTQYNGVARMRLARLEADGTLDTSFDPAALFDNTVRAIAVQPDGKVLVGGAFSNTDVRRMARLNMDGTRDLTFPYFTSFSYGTVHSIDLLQDGRIMIGGSLPGGNIRRLNADGSGDVTFLPGTGSSGTITDIELLPNERCILVGTFDSYNGNAAQGVARLNGDGSFDPGFHSGAGFYNVGAKAVARQSTGRLLFIGALQYDRLRCQALMATSADGIRDIAFNHISGFDNEPSCVAVEADGDILVGGSQIFNGVIRRGLARLTPAGDLDPSLDPGDGPGYTAFSWGNVNAIAPLADGRILVGGTFWAWDSVPVNHVARLLSNGSLDPTFNTGTGPNAPIKKLLVQPDGKLILLGSFDSYDGVARYKIARIEADGALDASFDATNTFTSSSGTGQLNTMELQPDGKLLVGGFFDSVQGQPRNNIVRLNPDGTLDPSFDAGAAFSDVVLGIALQADGRILCSGFFENVTGLNNVDRIARLMPDGAIDPSFAPSCGFCGLPAEPTTMIVQPDGRILVSGAFYTGGGAGIEGIMRFMPDGSVDPDFVSDGFRTNMFEASYASYVPAMAMQADGKVVCVGRFASYDGAGRNGIARIYAYDVSTGTPGPVPTSDLTLFPLPNDGGPFWFTTGADMERPVSCRVLDAAGRVVHAQPLLPATGSPVEVTPARRLPPGTFVLQAITASGRVLNAGFVVQ